MKKKFLLLLKLLKSVCALVTKIEEINSPTHLLGWNADITLLAALDKWGFLLKACPVNLFSLRVSQICGHIVIYFSYFPLL